MKEDEYLINEFTKAIISRKHNLDHVLSAVC